MRVYLPSFGLLVTWGAILCMLNMAPGTAQDQSANAHIVLLSLFAFGRLCHTIVYSLSLSYLRSLAWAIGVFSQFAIAANGIAAAFQPSITP